MIVVNLYGGPGAGKSTGAAYVFSRLKEAGVVAELVTEFAKDLTWDHSRAILDQMFVFGTQYHRLARLELDGVQVAVTDSPLLLSVVYAKNDTRMEHRLSARDRQVVLLDVGDEVLEVAGRLQRAGAADSAGPARPGEVPALEVEGRAVRHRDETGDRGASVAVADPSRPLHHRDRRGLCL